MKGNGPSGLRCGMLGFELLLALSVRLDRVKVTSPPPPPPPLPERASPLWGRVSILPTLPFYLTFFFRGFIGPFPSPSPSWENRL